MSFRRECHTGRNALLYTRAELLASTDGENAPFRRLTEEFCRVASTRDFPCVFARSLVSREMLLFGWARGDGPGVARLVRPLMTELAAAIRVDMETIGVIFVEDGVVRESIAEDVELARSIVQELVREACSTWPAGQPSDMDDPRWTLWFDGVPFFLNFSTPRHERRRSRRLGSTFTVVAQSRQVFDLPAYSAPSVRAHIRERLTTYDDVQPHPSLGRFGDEDNREALQFFLGDGLEPIWLHDHGRLSR